MESLNDTLATLVSNCVSQLVHDIQQHTSTPFDEHFFSQDVLISFALTAATAVTPYTRPTMFAKGESDEHKKQSVARALRVSLQRLQIMLAPLFNHLLLLAFF